LKVPEDHLTFTLNGSRKCRFSRGRREGGGDGKRETGK